MSDGENQKTFAQITQEIQQVFPDEEEGYIRRILDNIVHEITIERNLKKRETPITSVSGQMFYPLNDLGPAKITRVDFQDSEGNYVLIPRLVDGEFIRKWDQT